MTDLKKHLPEIFKLVRKELNVFEPSENLSGLDQDKLSELRQKLIDFLPGSYGVTAGRLVNKKGQLSRPLEIILYDKTIQPETTYSPGFVPVQQALAVLELSVQLDGQSLTEALQNIRSAKKLKPSDLTPTGAGKAIPKQLFPLGIVMFRQWQAKDEAAPGLEKLTLTLNQLIKQVCTSAEEQPDYLFALEAGLAYRNPLLEGYRLAEYQFGFYQEPALKKPRQCYVCKARYFRRHFFYESLCPDCGDLNYFKRHQTANLKDRIALVTGGRVKIGYATALHLLRAEATVLVTTRFPHDAARRYAQEPDFEQWHERLHIYGLDLRYLPGLEAFVRQLYQTYPRLDILINNAAQTVRRPPAFYAHLLPFEQLAVAELPLRLQPLLANSLPATAQLAEKADIINESVSLSKAGNLQNMLLSNNFSPLTVLEKEEQANDALFPPGEYDQDGQQIDRRPHNSWTMALEEISLPELVEVQLINSVAPAFLVGQLKQLMLRNPENQPNFGYIINVSAVEGQFAQAKQGYHPHTNMAKAALNMLTHTIATPYAEAGIFVNSVDPGWISEQAPYGKELEPERLPLDLLDAAARLCDPIFQGVNQGQHDYGRFFKDYTPTNW